MHVAPIHRYVAKSRLAEAAFYFFGLTGSQVLSTPEIPKVRFGVLHNAKTQTKRKWIFHLQLLKKVLYFVYSTYAS